MDPALMKQRQEFMKNAIKSMAPDRKKKPKKKPTQGKDGATEDTGKKADAISNAANFGIMAKIVLYMKNRHLDQKQWSLSLREITDEMGITYEIPKKAELWLKEALPKNPRLQTEEDGKLKYVPPYKVKNRPTLLALLKKHHVEGKGGVLLSELNDCIPNVEQHIKALGDQVVDVPTQINKRKDHVYFYNEPETDMVIENDFVALWRLASVDHMDEKKIEEYLQKHGINAAKDLAQKRLVAAAPKRKQKRKIPQKTYNVHLAGVLEDYEET
ncbi:TFIIE beta subunit core domain-containing protein [Ditylenchus destructor]|uniref:Transcription initiation factor IIE subunit beta n=1 Tax=Ditylenchus destructor TaxID=166010 RepID=A0AAD4QY11_9BILA|nr:TFIIE beta subunit core domain-containing protein [Ditylenchus destructor]